jgi:hypothetical protein
MQVETICRPINIASLDERSVGIMANLGWEWSVKVIAPIPIVDPISNFCRIIHDQRAA